MTVNLPESGVPCKKILQNKLKGHYQRERNILIT